MAFVVVPGPISLFGNEIRTTRVIKMLVFSVVLLCCMIIFYRNTNESEALIIYDPRYRYYNLAAGSYGRYYDQERYKIYSDTEVTKKSSHKRKVKSQPPIDLSFEPLGALKIDSLTHGQIEINPDKIDDVLLSLASGTLSMIPDIYQYIPSLPSFYGGEEPAEPSSEDHPSHPKKRHHRNNDEDEIEEDDRTKETSKPHDDESGNEDDSETTPKHHSDDKSDQETPEDHDDDDDNAAEEHDDDSKTSADASKDESDKNSEKENDKSSKESSKEHENSKESPKEPEPETGTEIPPIEEVPREGYVDKFVKYYSYAKPVVKAASLFVPGLGQYRAVMLGMEMGDLAYNLASMYSNGDGYLSMGYFLGKEAFKRLGRRNEPLPIPENSPTNTSLTDLDAYLEKVKNTQYPTLNDEKEQEIKTSVANIVYKYCHDQEQYQNEEERTKFIDLMISCVKFIAFYEILPAASSN